MNIESFNKNIEDILNIGSIENINISNIDMIKNITLNDDLNPIIYKQFMNNYKSEYGNDSDFFVMKIQDLLYRLHLLINHIFIDRYDIKDYDFIYDTIFYYIINDSLNLYDAVSYDDTDLKELENELPIESEEFKL